MSVTATLTKKPRGKKPRAKKAARAKAKGKTSARRVAANRRNAQKSTGPKTAAGKARSRHNAVTHGLTARSGLLPGEDAAEFFALQQTMLGRFKPCNDSEVTLVERIAIDIWTSDRAAQAASKRLAERLRHEPLEKDKAEKNQAIELGGLLLWQPAFPLPITKKFQIGALSEPTGSDNPAHPNHPARLCLKLQQTVAGCDWLLDRWRGLSERLNSDRLWLSSDVFHMVRLLGQHAISMAENLEVARIFLASLTLLGAPADPRERASFDWKAAMIRMVMTFDADQDHGSEGMVAQHCGPFARRLAELPLAALAPADEIQARQWLTSVINRELGRISPIRDNLAEIAAIDREEAPARLAFETGTEGDRHRRYVLANERQLNRRFDLFLSTRRMSEQKSCRARWISNGHARVWTWIMPTCENPMPTIASFCLKRTFSRMESTQAGRRRGTKRTCRIAQLVWLPSPSTRTRRTSINRKRPTPKQARPMPSRPASYPKPRPALRAPSAHPMQTRRKRLP